MEEAEETIDSILKTFMRDSNLAVDLKNKTKPINSKSAVVQEEKPKLDKVQTRYLTLVLLLERIYLLEQRTHNLVKKKAALEENA